MANTTTVVGGNDCCEEEEVAAVAVAMDEAEGDGGEGLIPGLPDDVAMECLVRVPSASHRRMRGVCRRWCGAVRSVGFRCRRRLAGAEEDLVFLVQAVPAADAGLKDRLPAYGIGVLNLATGEWRRAAAAAPWGPVPLFAQCAAGGDGGRLILLGGWDPATLRPAQDVRVLDLAAGAWRPGRPMPAVRSLFGCAVDGHGRVYVAGGHDDDKNALRTAAVYDVSADRWLDLPDMSEERDEPQLVAVHGRLLAAGGYATEAQGVFKKSAEWYLPDQEASWSDAGDILSALPEAARLAAVGGRLWSVAGGKGGVREWEGRGGAWKEVADGPEGMEACAQAVGVGDGVVAFGTVAGAGDEGKHGAWVMEASDGGGGGGARWRRLAVPPGFVYSAAAVRV